MQSAEYSKENIGQNWVQFSWENKTTLVEEKRNYFYENDVDIFIE